LVRQAAVFLVMVVAQKIHSPVQIAKESRAFTSAAVSRRTPKGNQL
jgi:hypothetical protein